MLKNTIVYHTKANGAKNFTGGRGFKYSQHVRMCLILKQKKKRNLSISALNFLKYFKFLQSYFLSGSVCIYLRNVMKGTSEKYYFFNYFLCNYFLPFVKVYFESYLWQGSQLFRLQRLSSTNLDYKKSFEKLIRSSGTTMKWFVIALLTEPVK